MFLMVRKFKSTIWKIRHGIKFWLLIHGLDTNVAQDHLLPATGIDIESERKLSAVFIKPVSIAVTGEGYYGTRQQSVLLINNKQSIELFERTYGLKGEILCEKQYPSNWYFSAWNIWYTISYHAMPYIAGILFRYEKDMRETKVIFSKLSRQNHLNCNFNEDTLVIKCLSGKCVIVAIFFYG